MGRGSGSLWGIAGLAGLLVMTGCSRLEIKLGTRVSLPKIPVTSMQASLPKGPGVAPGEKTPLVVTFAEPDGTVLTTSGAGKGKVLWSDLAVTASVVTVNKKGIVSLRHDPRVSDGKTGHVEVTIPSHPGLSAAIDVPVRYDYAFAASYAGSRGLDGINGNNGLDGAQGSQGSIDLNNPSPGGNGGDGTDGTSGTDGSNGGDGPAVAVRMTVRPGTPTLLEFGVEPAGEKERYFLVDPQGGSLTVTSSGGAGGSGGKGGRGGRGGSGGSGSPSGSSGRDGQNGRDGSDGSSGSDGPIRVTYDPGAAGYLSVLQFGRGARPEMTEAPVPPLW